MKKNTNTKTEQKVVKKQEQKEVLKHDREELTSLYLEQPHERSE